MKFHVVQSVGIAFLVALVAGCSDPQGTQTPERIDLSMLLRHMTNINSMAEAPLGHSFLESSYDRSGGNIDWATYTEANADGRVEVFSTDGAGYISRVWIASFGAKRWLFFIDGEEEPRLNLTQKELFGNQFPFATPLAGRSGGGRYSMLPIPFSKGIRVEIEPYNLKRTNRNYFQINYTKVDTDPISVVSFPVELSAVESNLVVKVNRVLANKEDDLRREMEQCDLNAETKIVEPGGFVEFWSDDTQGLLKSFSVKIEEPAPAQAMSAELLRTLRLQMFWDGNAEPSVDVPLGDFFCNPFYFRSYSALPMGYVDGNYVCRFPMPYANGARCLIRNTSAQPVTLRTGATGDRESSEGLTRTFHAMWRASTTSGKPLPIMETQGAGHYVGCFLTAIGQDGTWNILEGDEYLRPDPGKQPPQLGTGLEDYFSGAYYYTSLFDLPFHGLTEKGAMRTDQYRFHMLETVAFGKEFDMGIEFGHGNKSQGYMSSMAYWYLDQPQAVPMDSSYTHLLARPTDRFELPGLMAQFFQLERGGLSRDAAARMEFFANRYASQPWVDMFKVRALGYQEMTEGFGAVEDQYRKLAKSSFPSAAKAAADMLWLQENPDHALLGIHAIAKFKVLLDGKLVAQGEGRGELKVIRVNVPDGEHAWELDLQPTRQGSFTTLFLRKANAEITSAGEWDVLSKQVGKVNVPEQVLGNQMLPNMTVWAMEPNAYPGMQSPPSGVILWRFYEGTPIYKNLKIKKTFVLQSGGSSSALLTEAERSEEEMKANAVNVN